MSEKTEEQWGPEVGDLSDPTLKAFFLDGLYQESDQVHVEANGAPLLKIMFVQGNDGEPIGYSFMSLADVRHLNSWLLNWETRAADDERIRESVRAFGFRGSTHSLHQLNVNDEVHIPFDDALDKRLWEQGVRPTPKALRVIPDLSPDPGEPYDDSDEEPCD